MDDDYERPRFRQDEGSNPSGLAGFAGGDGGGGGGPADGSY